ncbi:unnamed protein product [Prorocentrum cordatum]|uniref:Very-long-chain 3-oxoacyl-CoA synthase n=1 Tax=Prorocentrum cordatum TaxID=2364126 RepID=A0ABN9UK74_9DINO|nr:unnamed protein product [Polarella glacialis]
MNQGKARPHITHFLAAQALSKFMSFIFWASSFTELINKNHYIKELVAFWVVGMQMVQILIMVDFIHNYLYCMWYSAGARRAPRGAGRRTRRRRRARGSPPRKASGGSRRAGSRVTSTPTARSWWRIPVSQVLRADCNV